ncbi:ceramide synthase 6-like [Glandiceps talaboti]
MVDSYSWFWNEQVWLPENLTWSDLECTGSAKCPRLDDLYVVFYLYAPLLFVIRILYERIIAAPIAKSVGISTKRFTKAQPNVILENVYKTVSKTPPKEQIVGCAKQLDWSPRQVERWFRRRRNQDMPPLLTKFSESSWRFLFYLLATTYALYNLKNEDWFWDSKLCWYGYPKHQLTEQLEIYYMVELSFYWALLFSQFFDVKRKDFLETFIHHVVTIMLITFSWTVNYLRMGAIVLVIHDCSDIFLEAAKMANYVKSQKLCDSLFILFAVVFFITRLIIYPLHVLKSVVFESWVIIAPTTPRPLPWWIFMSLLSILQVLHVFWFYTIVRMIVMALRSGKVEKDDRSDQEEISSDEDEVVQNGKHLVNSNSNSNSNSDSKS